VVVSGWRVAGWWRQGGWKVADQPRRRGAAMNQEEEGEEGCFAFGYY